MNKVDFTLEYGGMIIFFCLIGVKIVSLLFRE